MKLLVRHTSAFPVWGSRSPLRRNAAGSSRRAWQPASLLDEDLGEAGKNAPVVFFVGVGQRAARGGLAAAGVIEFRAEGGQTGFDVAETFTPGQLGKGQDEELFVSGEFADAEVAVVARDTLVELVFGEVLQELGEDGATFVPKGKNRREAIIRPRRTAAKLKSKKSEPREPSDIIGTKSLSAVTQPDTTGGDARFLGSIKAREDNSNAKVPFAAGILFCRQPFN